MATLTFGLRDNSRIKKNLTESKLDIETTLIAKMADDLSMLLWSKTKDGQKGRNKPKSILAMLSNAERKEDSDIVLFESGEDFRKAWLDIVEG